jgi:uncharacterized membrane protein YfcA
MSLAHIPHFAYVWLIVASTIAGVMNAMAGGGSFFSFPAMLGVGVLPVQANATNTVALWPGQLTAVATLRGQVRWDLVPTIAITSIVGGVAGAEVLLHTGQSTFLHLIPWLILCATALFAVSTPVSRWIRQRVGHVATAEQKERPISRVGLGCALLPICFYVGYFGAGGGILAMTALALFGMEDMQQLNAMKVVLALVANLCAIVTFILTKQIVWHYCLVSMVFAGAGGWMGAHFAKRTNPAVLRGLVVATGCAISAYFFWRQAHVR